MLFGLDKQYIVHTLKVVTRQAVTFRFPADLVQWLKESTGDREQTAFVERLLQAKREDRLRLADAPTPPSYLAEQLLGALRERRLIITSEPAPYTTSTGASPDFPVLVCHDPK